MKKAIGLLRQYKLFGSAIAVLVAALILEALHQHTVAHWMLGTVSLVEAAPLVWDMLEDVRAGRYGIDILAVTAIVASVILRQYWAAIIVVVMLTGGESLENFAERRAHSELDALLIRAPQLAHVIRARKTLDVKASEVIVGDKIIIKPGEVVPVDSTIIEGISSFDESSLTGESLPVTKEIGDQLLSGSINVEGAVTAKAVHNAADSQYQQIIKLVRSAAASQAPFVRLADRYSIPFTIAAYIIAGAVWFISGHAIRFLEVIIVATPCPLLLAAPIALISGMSRASKFGIIVKTGKAFEQLAEAETFAFDKTGTLTIGKPVVDAITTYGAYSEKEILSLAASLEQNSNHVLAHAVVSSAAAAKLRVTKAKHIAEQAGHGLQARVKNQMILVGRLGLMEANDVTLPNDLKPTDFAQTAAYVAIDGKLAGVISFRDEPRANSKSTLDRLKRLGIRHTLMVTGDNESVAQAVAKQLGIAEVKAEALPADKLRAIEKLTQRPVVFVGDGVNDAPVLTSADIGIALGARGSTAASESADLVIMHDDIGRVATALAIAKRTFKIARQSILIGISISLGLMLIFATGKLQPLYGAILQEIVDVIVIFNALRAHLGGKQEA